MLYIGTDDGIYRWFPGANWPIFHSLQGRAIVDLASPGGGVIVAVDNTGRVWETTSNGQDWNEVPLPTGAGRPSALALAWTPAEIVMAMRPKGLYRRPVGLVAESPEGPPSRFAWLAGVLFGTPRESGVTATATLQPTRLGLGGWTPMAAPGAEMNGSAPTIRALVPGEGEALPWFAAVAGAGLWRSLDDGASWEPCLGLPSEVYAIRRATQPAGTIAVATNDGCWVSTDHGASWTDRSGGLEKTRHIRAIEIKPGNANHMLAGAAPVGAADEQLARRGGLQFALYETKDGGKTWAHVARGFPDILEYDTITDIRFEPTDPDYAVVSLASGELWNTRTDGLWWEPLARQIHSARVLCPVG